MQHRLEFWFNIGFCALLLLVGALLPLTMAYSHDLARTYYMDSDTGQDSNDGSINAPFASFNAIQNLSNSETSAANFMVYLSPGEYPLEHFHYPFNQNWVFSTCQVCPKGAKAEGRASVLISPLPGTRTFEEKSSGIPKTEAQLAFINMDFRPGENNIFDGSIFSVPKGGVAFTNCTVQNFNISYTSDTLGGGLVSVTYGPLLYNGLIAINNSVASLNVVQKFLPPIFGQSYHNRILVNNSIFEKNEISGWIFTGGLVSGANCTVTVINTVFRSNTGYAALLASGMSLHLGGPSKLALTNCVFDSNQLFVLPYMWSGNQTEALGETYGGALSFSSETDQVVLRRSHFIRNRASEGGSLYVGDPQGGTSEWTGLKIRGAELQFEANQATSGVGAALVIRGPIWQVMHLDQIDMIANKVSRGAHFKHYPGSPLSSASPVEPSVVLLEDLASVVTSLTNWRFMDPEDHLRENTTFVTHRIRVHSCIDFTISNVSYQNVFLNLNEASASLIDIRDTQISTILHANLVLAPQSSSLPRPSNSMVLISCQGDTVGSHLRIESLIFSDASRTQLTLLIARGLQSVVFAHSTIQSESFSTARLALFEDCSSVLFTSVQLSNFAGPIRVLDTQRFLAFNSTFDNYKGRDPIFSLIRSSKVLFSDCTASNFSHSVIHAETFRDLSVNNSTFSNGELSQLGGSLSLSEGQNARVEKSSWSSISGVQGPAISASLVKLLDVSDSTFTSTVSRLSGGAINFDGNILWISNSRFTQSWAIGGSGGAVEAGVILATLNSNTFVDCGASETGGAIRLNTTDPILSNSSIRSSVFMRNKANSGGAITLTRTDIDIKNSTFLDNVALLSSGGAVKVDDLSSVRITSCNFTSNRANKKGGAVYLERTYEYVDTLEKGIFESSQSRYTENSASEGGALALDSNFSMTGSVNWMTSNRATYGGAINVQLPSNDLPNFSNFVFERNSASVTGSVIIIYASQAFGDASPDSWKHNFLQNNVFLDQPNTPSLQFSPLALLPIIVSTRLYSDPLGYTDQDHYEYPPDERPVTTLYPAIPRSLLLKVEDQLGTTSFNYSQWSISFQWCESSNTELTKRLQLDSDFRPHLPSDAGLGDPPQVILSIAITLAPDSDSGSSGSSLTTSLRCLLNLEVPSLGSQSLWVKISPCGIGTGPSQHSSDCIICPLGSYSFNGSCVSCIDNPYVSCFGGFLIPDRNYWVLLNPPSTKYQVLRCPTGFCTPKNPRVSPCNPDRTGVMCGDCVDGLSESILPTCIKCTKPNWVMICIWVVGLWIAVLVLHSLVAVSSGKATILLFFIQASFVINRQISLFGSERQFPAFISFIVCVIPLDPLARSLLIGLMPFVLMLMITTTFGIRYLALLILGTISPYTSNRPQNIEHPAEVHVEDTIAIPQYEAVEQDEDTLPLEPQTEGEAEQVNLATIGTNEDDPLGVILTDDRVLEETGDEKVDTVDLVRVNEFYQYQVEMVFWHPYRLIRTILSLLAGSFSSVLGIAISTIHCVTLLDGRQVLQSSPSVSCSSRRFKIFQYLNFIWAPFLILLFFGILWKLVHGYRNKKLSATDVRFGMWYEMYKPSFFVWKSTEMIRRFVLSITAELLLSSPASRSIALFAISICFLAIHLITKPYRVKLENRLETLSLTCLVLISLVNIWNVHLFALTNPPKASIYFVWVLAIVVSAIIGLTIVFTKVRSAIFARTT